MAVRSGTRVMPNLSRYDVRAARRTRLGLAAAAAGLALLLAAQLGATVVLARRGAGDDGQAAALAREIEVRESRLSEVGDRLSAEERRVVAARIRFLNQVLEARAFSWTGLLSELERAIPSRVRLVEVEPDPASGKVRLRGVAASAESLAAFTRGLERRPAFTEVFLLQQSDRPAGKDLAGLDFQVSLVYRGRP